MNNEEKAQAYDEALERARKQRDEYQKEFDKTDKNSQLASILRAAISAVEMAFPELVESDDEKIREEMIRYFTEMKKGGSASLPYDDCIAYLERQKEQKPAEKQNYANLTDLERTIHRGFLAAGVDNVPVEIIKETAKECLTQMKPAEWSKEDKQCFDEAIEALESLDFNGEASNLKSLRDCRKPLNTWKPTEEQIIAVEHAYNSFPNDCPTKTNLRHLYFDLKKLI